MNNDASQSVFIKNFDIDGKIVSAGTLGVGRLGREQAINALLPSRLDNCHFVD